MDWAFTEPEHDPINTLFNMAALYYILLCVITMVYHCFLITCCDLKEISLMMVIASDCNKLHAMTMACMNISILILWSYSHVQSFVHHVLYPLPSIHDNDYGTLHILVRYTCTLVIIILSVYV